MRYDAVDAITLRGHQLDGPDFSESVRREIYMIRYQTRDLREYRGAIRTLELIWDES